MQAPKIEHLPGRLVKLTFTVSQEEAQPFLDETAHALQETKPIAGFRPGKAPYAEVVKQFGEMRIWENALERIVRAAYVHAILENELDTIGSPSIDVTKLVPGSPIEFTVTAPIAPSVTRMADYASPIVDFSPRAVSDEDVEKALAELRRMQRKEVRSAEPATKEDLVIIDLEMKKEQVILEGGSAKGYRVYLAEDQYIPGFSDQLVGMKEGEERTFTLPFPKEHFQKHLAGRDVDFTAKASQIFKIELPALDDAFAKTLGQENIDALRGIIRRNLELEEGERAKQSAEIALLEKLVDGSAFSDIPELLINDEIRKMVRELESAIDERGMKIDDYLASLKKSKDELKLEFVPQAIRRIKTATLVKEVAKLEKTAVGDVELDAEIDRILNSLRSDDKDARERVSSPDYREYVAIMMRNRKTIELLREKGIKGWPHDEEGSGDMGQGSGHDHEHCHHDHEGPCEHEHGA
jgi:trigger factor